MAVWTYQGRTVAGSTQGEVEAPDRNAAVAILRGKGVLTTAIKEKPAGAVKEKKIGGKVKDREMAIFTRQFSTMIDAGLPLVQCLNILAEQSESKNLRDVTSRIARDVESGSSLADAFGKHPRTFDDLFTNMIEVGESGGILDVVLQRLSVYIEKAAALRRKVKAAMIYPLTIVSVALIVVIFMLTFVIPTFASMFKNLGADLPLPTKIVLWLSNFVQSYILLILAGLAAGIYALRRYYRTEAGQMVIDALLLKLPVFGVLIRKVAVTRFTRTLGTLISSGVSILDGLEITARTAGNMVIHNAVMESRASIAGGETIAAPLQKSKVFPPMVISMIAVGEQTGGLDEMLTKIADFYDDEVDAAVSALLSLLEPIMIVVLGVIVGGMVVAMYLPIFDMVNAVQ